MKPSSRIYHPWFAWECYKAGFFNTTIEGVSSDDAKLRYKVFLEDLNLFETGMKRVLAEWPVSCEHWLSNTSMNRVAWMGQAAMCIMTGVPACFRGGYKLLSETAQIDADTLAQAYITKWEESRCS